MNFVQRYWEDYNGELLQQGLDEQLPANQGGIDRRGFEWFYWQRKMSSGHITLKGHTGLVSSVAFSPDGKRLASASVPIRTVKVWDAATGRGTPHPQGAHRRCLERGVQPRRPAARLRQSRQDGEGVGRRDPAGNRSPSRGTPAGSIAWRSARTASGSPLPPVSPSARR